MQTARSRGPRTGRAVTSPPPATGDAATDQTAVAGLIPLVQRVVRSRVRDPVLADDLVQETLTRVLTAVDRVEPAMLEPYAIVTARHVVASMWEAEDRRRRNLHRVVDLRPPSEPDESLILDEEHAAVARAMARLDERDRELLQAHEVAGQDTGSLAGKLGLSKGAVAAQLNRTRARLRVEYLLELEDTEPPTDRCRPVLLALSGGDRRRQREVDAARHLLECATCGRLSGPLLDRLKPEEDLARVRIHSDPDIVTARQQARALAEQVGFSRTDLTLIATAVSEISRNIVRFAGNGEVVINLVEDVRAGVTIVARDTGPGIPDVEAAMADGFSTCQGLGLGLPGVRRLMDDFAIESELGRGTTVTMTKWRREG
jgi:RNA polymerase sigma factor (sigma-70 family)